MPVRAKTKIDRKQIEKFMERKQYMICHSMSGVRYNSFHDKLSVCWSSDELLKSIGRLDRSLRLNELVENRRKSESKKIIWMQGQFTYVAVVIVNSVLSALWVHTLKYTFYLLFIFLLHFFAFISLPGLIGRLAGRCISYDDRNLINIRVWRCLLFE